MTRYGLHPPPPTSFNVDYKSEWGQQIYEVTFRFPCGFFRPSINDVSNFSGVSTTPSPVFTVFLVLSDSNLDQFLTLFFFFIHRNGVEMYKECLKTVLNILKLIEILNFFDNIMSALGFWHHFGTFLKKCIFLAALQEKKLLPLIWRFLSSGLLYQE